MPSLSYLIGAHIVFAKMWFTKCIVTSVGKHISETSRPLVTRFQEYYSSLSHPTAKSYKKNDILEALQRSAHPGVKPKLSVKVLSSIYQRTKARLEWQI